jgi:hypothetical protein
MLDKDILGTALYNAEKQFNDKDPAALGDIEEARKAFWKVMADEIIKHFKVNGILKVPGTGLVSFPNGVVSGQSITGKIE